MWRSSAGKGVQAIKLVLAGAAEARPVTPMLQKRCSARSSPASPTGIGDRFHCVVAVAEQLPFGDEVFDAIYVVDAACTMSTDLSGPEIGVCSVREEGSLPSSRARCLPRRHPRREA